MNLVARVIEALVDGRLGKTLSTSVIAIDAGIASAYTQHQKAGTGVCNHTRYRTVRTQDLPSRERKRPGWKMLVGGLTGLSLGRGAPREMHRKQMVPRMPCAVICRSPYFMPSRYSTADRSMGVRMSRWDHRCVGPYGCTASCMQLSIKVHLARMQMPTSRAPANPRGYSSTCKSIPDREYDEMRQLRARIWYIWEGDTRRKQVQ